MTGTWTKLDDGTWGARLESAPWPQGTGVGMPVTLKSNAGQKSSVVLGDHVKVFRVAGGHFIDIYKVAS